MGLSLIKFAVFFSLHNLLSDKRLRCYLCASVSKKPFLLKKFLSLAPDLRRSLVYFTTTSGKLKFTLTA